MIHEGEAWGRNKSALKREINEGREEEPQEHLPLVILRTQHLSSQLYFLGLSVIFLHSIEVYLFKDNVVPRSLFPGTIV